MGSAPKETSETASNGARPVWISPPAATSAPPKSSRSRDDLYRILQEQLVHEALPLTLGTLALLGSSLSNQAFPRLVGKLIDNDVPTQSLGWLVVGGGLASCLRTTLLRSSKDSIATRLRQQAFASLLLQDYEWFQRQQTHHQQQAASPSDEERAVSVLPPPDDSSSSSTAAVGISTSPASLAAILGTDVDQMANLLTTTLANAVRSMSAVFFSAYHMWRLDPHLLGASMSVIPLIGASAMLLRRTIKRLLEDQTRLSSDSAAFVEERIANVALVQLAHRQDYEVSQYKSLQRNLLHHDQRVAAYQGGLMGFLFASSATGLLFVVRLGGKSVACGRLTPGQLTSFATYSFLLGLGTSGLVQALGEWTRGMVSAERYLPLLVRSSPAVTTPLDGDTEDEGIALDPADVHSIALESVSFAYRSNPSATPNVLHDVSLVLDRGTVTALVGRNGSGKTTVAALLAGLLHPTSGRVALSTGHSLSELPPAIRANVLQFVPQSTSAALWNATILDNVRYCSPTASEADVWHALDQAGCTEWVKQLPLGLYHPVGRGGCHLSGGQAQRLVLARALLTNPAILVLDEPASHLDADGAAAVAKALVAAQQRQQQPEGGNINNNAVNYSRSQRSAVLIVTHHPQSLELVDRIVVLRDGYVVESGTLSELRNPHSHLCHIMPALLD